MDFGAIATWRERDPGRNWHAEGSYISSKRFDSAAHTTRKKLNKCLRRNTYTVSRETPSCPCPGMEGDVSARIQNCARSDIAAGRKCFQDLRRHRCANTTSPTSRACSERSKASPGANEEDPPSRSTRTRSPNCSHRRGRPIRLRFHTAGTCPKPPQRRPQDSPAL